MGLARVFLSTHSACKLLCLPIRRQSNCCLERTPLIQRSLGPKQTCFAWLQLVSGRFCRAQIGLVGTKHNEQKHTPVAHTHTLELRTEHSVPHDHKDWYVRKVRAMLEMDRQWDYLCQAADYIRDPLNVIDSPFHSSRTCIPDNAWLESPMASFAACTNSRVSALRTTVRFTGVSLAAKSEVSANSFEICSHWQTGFSFDGEIWLICPQVIWKWCSASWHSMG